MTEKYHSAGNYTTIKGIHTILSATRKILAM